MMQAAKAGKPIREGSATKRRAILEAARALFVREGVDRVSMDAVAAAARVSKATVYEYFGDKQRLFRAILADASASLEAIAHRVIEEHLRSEDIASVAQLEGALTAAAVEFGATVVGASEYAAVFALVSQRRWHDPEAGDDLATQSVEDAFAERIAHFAERGLLDAEDPRRATDHFFALTMLFAYNEQSDPATVDLERVRLAMTDGAHAFIRAYGAR